MCLVVSCGFIATICFYFYLIIASYFLYQLTVTYLPLYFNSLSFMHLASASQIYYCYNHHADQAFSFGLHSLHLPASFLYHLLNIAEVFNSILKGLTCYMLSLNYCSLRVLSLLLLAFFLIVIPQVFTGIC